MTYQFGLRACTRSATSRSHRIGALATLTAFLAVGLTFAGVSAPETAEAASVTFAQCNSLLNTPGQEVSCDVEVNNYLDTIVGAQRSEVRTTVCAGAASSTTCVTTPFTASSDIVDRVEQCNSSVDGAGAVMTCNVTVVNKISGEGNWPHATPATVNQCNDSSDGSGTMTCNPSAASTTNADIDQCNNSANGGGSHTECTVTTSTASSLLPVAINQCNDSANGGGSFVACTAQITNTFVIEEPGPRGELTPTTVAAGVTTTGAVDTVPVAPVATDSVDGDHNIPTTSFVFTPTDVTLPATGTGSLVTQSGVGSVVLLVGFGALFLTRRRQPRSVPVGTRQR